VDESLLRSAGAQEPAPDKWTTLAFSRFSGGLQTQRSPISALSVSRYDASFLKGRPDALIAGSNVEITNRLTPQRRPGLLAYGVSNVPSPTFFYDYNLATTGDILLTVDTNSSGGDNSVGAFGGVLRYSPTSSGIYINKSLGAKQCNFQTVVNTLYMGDQTDLFKNVGPNLLTQSNTFGIGAGTSFTIQAPWTENDIFALTGGQADPLGGSAATQLVWSTTGSAAFLQQIAGGGDGITGTNTSPNYTPLANNTFTFSIWMQQTGGTESVTISLRDQSGTIASKVCVLTSSWAKYQVTGTMGSGSTEVIVRVGSPTTTNTMAIYGAQLEVGGPATTTQITTTKPQGVYLWGIQAPVAAPTFITITQTGSTGAAWQPNTNYTLGQTIVDTNGNIEVVTTAGLSGGIEPSWNEQPLGTTQDGLQNIVIQTATSGTPASANTASVALPAAVTAGHQLLVAVYVSHPQTIAISDTPGDTFVSVLSNGKGGHQAPSSGDSRFNCVFSGQFTLYLFFVASAVGGATTISVSGGGNTGTYIAAAELNDITGLDTGAASTNSNQASGSSGGSFSTGGITSTNALDIIISVFAASVSASAGASAEQGVLPPSFATITSDTAMSIASNTAICNIGMALQSVTTASFYNPFWTITNPTAKSAVVGISTSLKTSVGTLVWTNQGQTFNGASGGLTTTLGYQYYFAYANSYTGHVSNVSPISVSTGVITGQTLALTGATRTMSNSGTYAADPQSDLILVFRNTDGGGFWYQLAVFGNGSTAQAALQAAGYAGLSTNVTYGAGTFTVTDVTPDSSLNTSIFAPIGLLNSLPPAGLCDMDWFAGRMWGSVGNLLYYSTGPDNAALLNISQNGVPSESWIGDNVVPFNAAITRIVSTGGGLVVFTTLDTWLVTGTNILSGGFNPQRILIGHGLRSYNAATYDGSNLYLFTSDKQQLCMNPNAGSYENGFPIGDLLETTVDPTAVYLARHVSGSQDNALFLATPSFWYRNNPNQAGASMSGEATSVWSPKADFTATIGGIGAIASIETSAGVTQLLVGLPPLNTSGIPVAGPVLVRSLTTFTDNGAAYSWSATFGSFVLATPGKVAEAAFVTTEMNNSGDTFTATQCGVAVLLDEISGPFESLPTGVNDPPGELPSVSVLSNRFWLSQGSTSPTVRHMQVKLLGSAVATRDEILSLAINGSLQAEQVS
jgi:hypothetical protein